MPHTLPPPAVIAANVRAALEEDIGSGDLSARLLPLRPVRASVIGREPAILCGQAWFDGCLHQLDPHAQIIWHFQDGMSFPAQALLCEIQANSKALLTAERSALNFLQLLSATATQTSTYVRAVAGTKAHIVDTRKTIPGLRLAQKYAVRCGGGTNHRCGLFDGVLLKENHIIAAGGIPQILQLAQVQASSCPEAFIQIEVETLDELTQALAAGAKLILLDNMSLEQLHTAVRITAGRALLEASGGVSLDSVRAIAETGVERISVGAITKNLAAIDLSLRLEW